MPQVNHELKQKRNWPQVINKRLVQNKKKMQEQDYSISINVDASAAEAFKAINSVTKWWTENLEGSSQKLNDEFTVRFGEVHVSTQKIIEFVPDKKVVWLVSYSNLNFIKDNNEWTGTKVIFEVSQEDKKTTVKFTHLGLAPRKECFDACSGAWNQYIEGSLLSLINTGKGQPALKEVESKARA